MYTESLLDYIHKKHKICNATLNTINTDGLRSYLNRQSFFQRASTVKLIHDWIPTYVLLHKQGRQDEHICPRCQLAPETATHIMCCSENAATTKRQEILYKMLQKLVNSNTSIYILSRLEQELTALLHITSLNRYNPPSDCPPKLNDCIQKAVCNQNIIGWANFLKGYISQYWITAQHSASSTVPVNEKQRWSSVISTFALDLYKQFGRIETHLYMELQVLKQPRN
jgi:hypothetical protein